MQSTWTMEFVTADDPRIPNTERDLLGVFPGEDEMAARCLALDWGGTPLGPAAGWPQSLRTTAALVLAMRFPAILLWGPELVQIYNDAYVPFLGVKHPAGLGSPSRACWPEVWPLVQPILARVFDGEAIVRADQHYPLLSRGAEAAPDDVYITLSYVPVRNEAGAVDGVLVTGVDTSAQVRAREEIEAARADADAARRRAERERARATSVLEAMADAHATLDREFRFVTVNPAAERALGKSRAELLGYTHLEMFPALEDSEAARAYLRVASEGVEAHFTEHYVGTDYDVHLEIDAYPTDDGGVAIFWRDVTERVRAEEFQREMAGHLADHNALLAEYADEREQLLAAAQAARSHAETATAVADAANRAKSEFLAVMSHELRTPLNAIGGYAELIEMGIRGPVTEEQLRDLARIQQSQRHLLGLINGVLNYVKVEGGHVYYEVTEVPVDEVVATAEALIAPQARAKRLTLRFDGCASTVHARADREKVQQVVLNLVSNAVKFTEPGGTVSLSCDLVGLTVAVRVTDTGRGIAAAECERVFHPFVQVDAKLTRTQEGTGLGLSISRDLARGMGGDLTLQSELGVGSTFTLTLPLAAT